MSEPVRVLIYLPQMQIYRLLFTSLVTWKSGSIANHNLDTNLNLCRDTQPIAGFFYGNLTEKYKVLTKICDIFATLFSHKIMINNDNTVMFVP